MRVKVYTRYNRYYLPQWQSIEAGIEKILHSWVVPHPDKSLKQQIPKPQVVVPGA
ncbi:hypothetical protein [Snodgrassella sp. CFCC 13594]|uniref:hypothetical protein n=1 Tax=Snodgrassella sp. CFCC 13594 TaxID=1775559 RepID=UPI0012E98986|nr:hypothetical protein [Snodgrassella sp. CFCC 13594]